MKALFSLLLFILAPSLWAQEFHYERWGESQFSGMHIYDVIQDNNKNYIFSTESGLLSFDGQNFTAITCEEMNSQEVFNFVKDSKGVVYCSNLGKQIFKIEDGKMELYKTIPESAKIAVPRLSVNANDDLIIYAESFQRPYIFVVNSQSDSVIDIPIRKSDLSISTIFTPDSNNNIVHIKHLDLNKNKGNDTDFSDYLIFNGNTYTMNIESKVLYYVEGDSLHFKKDLSRFLEAEEKPRFYTSDQYFFIATKKAGVIALNSDLEFPFPQKIFRDYLVSDIFQDSDGTLWFSTFDEGILLVKNTQLTRSSFDVEKPLFSMINVHNDSIVLLGSNKGALYNSNSTFDSINLVRQLEVPVESLFFWDYGNAIVFNKNLLPFDGKADKKSESATTLVKDAFQNSKGQFVIANPFGITILSKVTTTEIDKTAQGYSGRVYSIAYNRKKEIIWVAGSNGLIYQDSLGVNTKSTHKDAPLFIKQVETFGDSIFLLDKFQNMLAGNENGWKSLPLIKANKFNVCDYGIITVHRNSINVYNRKGDLINSLGAEEGFTNFKVNDFDVLGEYLYLLSSDVIVKVPLSVVFKPNKLIENFNIDIYQNDTITNLDKFQYGSRKIEIRFSGVDFKSKEDISFQYMLVGLENQWKTIAYDGTSIAYQSLSPGNYSLKVRAISDNQISEVQTFDFVILAPFYRQWWFIAIAIGVGLVLIFLLVKFLVRIQEKKIIAKNEVNAYRLTAIQSQMNPHFIFNSLNSLQGLILKGNVEKSYTYLNSFSNLIRSTIDNINEDYIEFYKELELIENYLELEKSRFTDSFVYEIKNDITENIKIPPMIIQPFIENALLHGLMHKEGDKKITITFSYTDHVLCTIEDNGIGREEAQKIKIRQAKGHKSFALNAIQKRFNILNKKAKRKYGFTYFDLEKDGASAGVRVELRIPVKTL